MNDQEIIRLLREEGHKLVTKKEVCPRCRGEGTHVNPAVDGNGISPEQFHEDPEFAENYFSGLYDITCEECGGLRVVDVVDTERSDPAAVKEFEEWIDSRNETDAIYEMERRMGA